MARKPAGMSTKKKSRFGPKTKAALTITGVTIAGAAIGAGIAGAKGAALEGGRVVRQTRVEISSRSQDIREKQRFADTSLREETKLRGRTPFGPDPKAADNLHDVRARTLEQVKKLQAQKAELRAGLKKKAGGAAKRGAKETWPTGVKPGGLIGFGAGGGIAWKNRRKKPKKKNKK
ncbi:MAG: hypothetical protein ABID38_01765 [Candidatus Diapherotrites archaeon]